MYLTGSGVLNFLEVRSCEYWWLSREGSDPLFPLFTNVARFGPDFHVLAGNLHADAMKAGAARDIIAEVVLLGELGADLIQGRRDVVLLSNVEGSAASGVRQGFQGVGIQQD